MIQLLSVAVTVWKLATKRFGYAGGIVATGLAVGGYLLLKNVLRERNPELADSIEQVA